MTEPKAPTVLSTNNKPRILTVADFETNTHEHSHNVYAWAIRQGTNYHFGFDILTFIDKCIELHSLKRPNMNQKHMLEVWFHNGSGFDTHAIIKALKRHNKPWRQIVKAKTKRSKTTYERMSNTRTLYGETKITDWNWRFEDLNDDTKNKVDFRLHINKLHQIRFRCSWRTFGGYLSVAKMGEMIGKPKLEDYDYERLRKYENLKAFKVDGNAYEYLKRDVDIVYEWLDFVQQKVLNYNQWKLSLASMAYHLFLKTVTPLIAEHFPNRYVRAFSPLNSYPRFYLKSASNLVIKKQKGKTRLYTQTAINKILFNELFEPIHNSPELRDWYFGGLSTPNMQSVGKPFRSLSYVDINSSYPSSMLKPMPIGRGVAGDGGKDYPLKLYTLRIRQPLYQNKTQPFLCNKALTGSYMCYTHLKPEMEFKVAGPLYEAFIKYYKPPRSAYTAIVYHSFKAIDGNKVFGPYVRGLYALKRANAPRNTQLQIFLYYFAKTLLNALYGKFGTNERRESKIYTGYFNGRTSYETEITKTPTKFYLPIAIFITSYARRALVDAEIPLARFVGGDTDSIIYDDTGDYTPNIKFGDGLGEYKKEHANVSGVYMRSKGYFFWKKDKIIKVVQSGMKFEKDLKNVYDINTDKQLFPNGHPPHSRVLFPYFVMGGMYTRQKRRVEGVEGFYFNKNNKSSRDIAELLADKLSTLDNLQYHGELWLPAYNVRGAYITYLETEWNIKIPRSLR